MTGTHNLVVLANPAPPDAEVLTGPETALRRAVRDLGGLWAHNPRPGDKPPIHTTRPAAEVDRQSTDAIWPIYHDAVQTPVFRPEWQLAHRDLNTHRTHAAARMAAPAGTVWIIGHDLQLAPAMLRACRPDTRIGFYLPIPFPPVELFLRLPFRDDILRGLLGADAIGVQTRGDVDNLVRAARYLFDVHIADASTLVQQQRRTTVAALPTSVDTATIAHRATSPASIARARDVRAQLGNPRLLILSVDHLDHAAGIEHRLHAFEQLLADRRLRTGQTAVVQIVLPPRHRTQADESLRGSGSGLSGRRAPSRLDGHRRGRRTAASAPLRARPAPRLCRSPQRTHTAAQLRRGGRQRQPGIKMIKRQLYGRANFDLLRKRILLAS